VLEHRLADLLVLLAPLAPRDFVEVVELEELLRVASQTRQLERDDTLLRF
jgi:hypothetical protein